MADARVTVGPDDRPAPPPLPVSRPGRPVPRLRFRPVSRLRTAWGRGGPWRGTSERRAALARRAAAFVVWYVRAVACVNLLSAVWVSLGQDVRRHNHADLFTPYLLTAGFASGVFTLFLAVTLRRRKRAAWILNLALAGPFLVLLGLAMTLPEVRRSPQNWVSLVLTAAFVGALLAGRREFYAVGDRANPRLAAALAAGGLLCCSLLAALLVTVTNQAPDAARSTFLERWHYGALRLVSVAADNARFPGIATPNGVDVAINVLSTVLLLAVVHAAFRSRRAVDPLTAEDERRLRELLARHGERDSLGYFALRREKSVVWSPTGKAAVAYRVVGGVSLASGDPLGDPEAWPGAIVPWLAEARTHGWIPAWWAPARRPAPCTRGTVWTRWSWATRHWWRPPSSPWRAGPCVPSARRTTGCGGRATGCGSGATRRSRPRRWRLCWSAPTTGATVPPSAVSAWRSGGSAIRRTGGA